jgi:hypothetical protein
MALRLRELVDVLALPFWILMLAYFWRKAERGDLATEEKILAAFAATGLLVDGTLTAQLLLG